MNNAITDVPGLKVGHWTNREAATGCTVILCEQGAVAGVDIRGGGPGTRETALLDPVCTVEKVHAIILAGGSAFGLAAADGVMHWLEEQSIGYDVGIAKVPIVPAAILFDLPLGRADVRPDAAAGYAACQAANGGVIAEGSVGAGTGATVGKLLGFGQAMKGGLGTASRCLENGIIIAALVVVNAAGTVIHPHTGLPIAGARDAKSGQIVDPRLLAERILTRNLADIGFRGGNTTLAVVATNVKLSKTGCTKVAQMAHDGLARSINPIHTSIDGDLVFALSFGNQEADTGLLGALAADILADAVVRAVVNAESLYGMPAAKDL
ncbi:MAG: P1 family peptidase [Caldilineaceae bacterium]